MKTKENIYLDLFKLSGEEIKEVYQILEDKKEPIHHADRMILKKGQSERRFPYLALNSGYTQWMSTFVNIHGKTEIDLSEFRQLFSKGEEEKTFTITEFSVGDFGDLGNVIGTIKATSKESAKTLFQKMRKISDGNIAYYSFSEVKTFDTTSNEVLQVENKINIDELSKLCNEYNRSNLKISNLQRDLEYKNNWSEESVAIQEIKQQISILQKIKETAQSKLQDIGIEF